tara:strand:+ start:7649 stop:8107 length:459 start_codon:yes stop_codon:yes gene_type:complete
VSVQVRSAIPEASAVSLVVKGTPTALFVHKKLVQQTKTVKTPTQNVLVEAVSSNSPVVVDDVVSLVVVTASASKTNHVQTVVVRLKASVPLAATVKTKSTVTKPPVFVHLDVKPHRTVDFPIPKRTAVASSVCPTSAKKIALVATHTSTVHL